MATTRLSQTGSGKKEAAPFLATHLLDLPIFERKRS